MISVEIASGGDILRSVPIKAQVKAVLIITKSFLAVVDMNGNHHRVAGLCEVLPYSEL